MWTPLLSCPHFHNHYDGDNDVARSSEPSKDKYTRPVCQSSLISIKIALIKRRQDASFGKIRTTRVRRRISWLSRSSKLDVRFMRWWLMGKENTANPSGTFCSNQSARCVDLGRYISTISLSQVCAVDRSGALKILRKSCATSRYISLRVT